MSNERLTKQVFLWDLNNAHGWTSDVQSLCNLIDCTKVVDDEYSPCNMTQLDVCLSNYMNKVWTVEVQKKAKLRTYIKYKANTAVDYYLLNPSVSRSKRSLFAQFRTGTLKLEIETGRFRNINAEERYCKVCKSGLVEDETHFLIQCTKYEQLRQTLFSNVNYANFCNMSDEEKFTILMKDHQLSVVNYLDKAWNMRKQYLFNPS